MWPFKKTFPPIDQLPEDEWAIGQGERDGRRIIIRFNKALRRVQGHPDYAHQVGVAVPLLNPDAEGLPTSGEATTLTDLEDKIEERLTQRAETVFAAVITTGGMRELVFYTSNPPATQAKVEQLNVQVASHELQLIIQHDPSWSVYKELRF